MHTRTRCYLCQISVCFLLPVYGICGRRNGGSGDESMSGHGVGVGFLVISLAWVGLGAEVGVGAPSRAEQILGTCTMCHGAQLEGNKSVAAPAIAGLPAWYVETQLRKFINGARAKNGKDVAGLRMRPMARTLKSDEDIKAISELVAAKSRRSNPATVTDASWVKGENSFQVCSSCHGAKAEGNQALGAPPLAGMDDWYVVTQLKNFKAKVRGYDAQQDALGVAMGGMAASLDETAMKNIATFVHGLGGAAR